MYKMKDVCQLTGLSEKTIRYYISQELISPRIENNLHYKSYRFSESDVNQLRDISALRSAEFSIAEIQQMLHDPDSIPTIVAEKERLLESKISSMQNLQDVIRNLTIEDHGDLSRIADAIEPRTPYRREQPAYANKRLVWLSVYAGIFLLLSLLTAMAHGFQFFSMLLLFLAGVDFPVMGIAYLLYNRKHRSLPCKCVGTVVSVITDEGIHTNWEETTWDTVYGMMNMGFIHWNWIRPDHWVPLIRFEADGASVLATYRYGALKGSWSAGDPVEIAWAPGKEKQIYPCSDPKIARKGWIYLLGGILSMVAFWMLTLTL